MKKLLVLVLALFLLAPGLVMAEDVIKIGFNIPLTGDIPDVGEYSKAAGELLKAKINAAGGLQVGAKKYKLEFVYEDNEAKAESAVSVANKLITQNNVLAMVGPQASKQAIAAGEVANNLKTPMISPWSTNPATTKDRPFVFRGCFLDPFQGPVLAKFASKEFKAKKAAVLYDIASDYPKGLAEFFKKAWEEINGPGSVVAFETFTTKDVDFSAQLTKIVNSKADILMVPQYYNEVPLIVKQAKKLGWNKPILGSDSWGGGDLMKLCGDDCKGYFFSTHWSNVGAKGKPKEFIDEYTKKYGKAPDDVAALTWDSIGLILKAIQNTGGLTGKLGKDREAVAAQLGKLKNYEGVTGTMSFKGDGDPVKCSIVVKINPEGKHAFFQSVCP